MAFDKKLNIEVIKTPKDSLTILTDSVLPGETNALNNLFGGELLARMDRAASISARRHSEQIVVTSSVNNVSFGKAIPIGTTVTIEAKVSRAFTTSMEVFIDVWVDDDIGKKIKANDKKTIRIAAYFKYELLTLFVLLFISFESIEFNP